MVGVAALVSASVFVLLGTSSGSGGAVISPSAAGTAAPDQVPPGQRSPVKQVKAGEAIKVPSDIDGACYWMTTDSVCRYAPHETTTYGKPDLAMSAFVECDTPMGTKNGRALICRMTVTAPPQTTGDKLPCAGGTPPDKYFSSLFARPGSKPFTPCRV